MSIGVTFPFALSTGTLGYLEVTQDVLSAIRSNARSLLLTNWGERVMHFDFGCNLREFLFEQKGNQLRARISDRVTAQFGRWMPYLAVRRVFIVFSDEDFSVPDPGFRIDLELTYGNIPVKLFELFPSI